MPTPTYTLDTFTKNLPTWNTVLDEPYKECFVNSRTNVLDIGAGEGPGTVWFADTLIKHPKSKVYSVDSWWQKETEKKFDANLVYSGNSNKVVKLKGNVEQIICELTTKEVGWNKFNIINYNYTTNSLEALNILTIAFSMLLKDDGIIAINNYDAEHKINILGGLGVHYKEALLFLQRLYAGRYEILGNQKLLMLKKLSPEQII
jgi:hypothetical protein